MLIKTKSLAHTKKGKIIKKQVNKNINLEKKNTNKKERKKRKCQMR